MSKGTRQGPAARKTKGDTRLLAARREFLAPNTQPQRRKRTQVAQIVPGNFMSGETEPYRVAKATASFMSQETPGDYQVRKNKHGYGVYLRENV